MFAFIFRRAGQSVIAVIGLLVLVFFLSRLTGDPAYLYLPLDSSEAQRQAFSRRTVSTIPWSFNSAATSSIWRVSISATR